MRKRFNIDFHTRSLRGKVIAIFMIAVIALGVSWLISRVAFGKIVTNVEEVTRPNEKLRILKDLSQYISLIGHDQRKQILQNPNKIMRVEINESAQILLMLDTLRGLCEGNKRQEELVDSVKLVIADYDKVVNEYLKTYATFFNDESLTGKFRSLSAMVAVNVIKVDTNIITTERKRTTTTIIPGENPSEAASEKHPSFLQRVFGSKKADPKKAEARKTPEPQEIVKNEVNVRVDTLVVSQRDSMIRQIEKTIRKLYTYNQQKSVLMAQNELRLMQGVNDYFDILQHLLRTIEAEELENINAGNTYLRATVKDGMIRISAILVLFIVIAFIFAYFIFSDISRSNMYRSQLLKAKEEAEFLGLVKQRFLSNMSHEIRTPLQSIIGFSEQMLNERQPSQQALEAINKSADHLLHIVNEVLDYTRITSGKFTLEKHVFDINEVLMEVSGIMKQQCRPKGIDFIYNTLDNVYPYYSGDSFRLKQILFNLIGNAIKFTEKGNIELKIEAVENEHDTRFRFVVKDTGVGISKPDLDVIFNEFEQGEMQKNGIGAGTGLGLSIVRTLVEMQGGSIEVTSQPGIGSVFTVQLTYDRATQAELTTPRVTHLFSKPEKISGKVLLIDDDPFIIKLCSTIFRKHGILYRCESSPVEVLESEWDEEISIVFMDIRMPQVNGIELCRLLRERIAPATKIVALTAHALPEEQETISKQGFDGLIVKPFKEKDLLSWLVLPVKEDEVSETVPFDFSYLRAISMDDPELIRNTLIIFTEETNKDIDLLRHIDGPKDYNTAREIVHKLAGRIGQIGDIRLSAEFRKIEKLFDENKVRAREINWLWTLLDETEKLVRRLEMELVESRIIR